MKVLLVAVSQYIERPEHDRLVDAEQLATAHALEEQLEARLTMLAETPHCGCKRGSTCDVAHDPATCPCEQCTRATREERAR